MAIDSFLEVYGIQDPVSPHTQGITTQYDAFAVIHFVASALAGQLSDSLVTNRGVCQSCNELTGTYPR